MDFSSLFGQPQQFDPSTFNYQSAQDQLKRRRAIADALQATQQPRGQMVPGGPNGFYVAPSKFAALSALLQTALGTGMSRDLDQQQGSLDKNAQAALVYQLQHLDDSTQTPQYSPAKDSEAANQIAAQDALSGAQASPVMPGQVQTTNLPPGGAAPSPIDMGTGSGWDSSGPQQVAPSGPPPGSAGNPVLTPPGGGQPQQPPVAPVDPAQLISQANPGGFASAPPSLNDYLSRLAALSQTSPQGAAIAQQRMALLGPHNDWKVDVSRDPQTGQLAVVRYNTRTGDVQLTGSDANGASQKVLETKSTPNGVMERTAFGWRPAIGPNGQPIMDTTGAADQRAATEQTANLSKALNSNQAAQASIDSSLARLDRIQQLSQDTLTGPFLGHLPDWTSKRQELHALMSQDIFAETRDAVAGAADAGGAPRMAQSEFKFMANNGGLSQNQDPSTIANLIAQQRMRLLALKQSLAQYGGTLQGSAPQITGGAAPARGQSVTAAQYGF